MEGREHKHMHSQTDELAVRRALKQTLGVWPGRLPDLNVYYDALADVAAATAETAVRQVVSEWRYSQRPLPGDFRRRALELHRPTDGLSAGEDGYLRGADGRHVVMDEMATREAYRREFNHIPPGWTDEALAAREAVRVRYAADADKPMAVRMRTLLDNLKRINRMGDA